MPLTANTPRSKLICLAGFMGCGKTTIGSMLARQLGWRFVDLDTRIEERAGLRITEIFDRFGEPTFRQMEHELLLQALGEAAELNKPTVLALGGGTFAQPLNVEVLRAYRISSEAGGPPEGSAPRGNACVVVWLDCPVEVLLARCATLTDRPLFRDEASFRDLYQQRLPFYQQADFRVESHGDPRQVVEQICAYCIPDASAGLITPRGVNA